MITMRKAFSVEYYTSGAETAVGVESYYLDGVTQGEPPGVWLGRGAETLGLSGEVNADDMSGVYNDFEHPHTGEALGRRPDRYRETAERVAAAQAAEPDALPERLEEICRDVERTDRTNTKGWDATFAVSKSVSVAHVAAQRAELTAIRSGDLDAAEEFRAIRVEIESAIGDANAAGIRTLEGLATARTGGGSGAPLRWVNADGGLTVASFFQHTNRSIDPHLHQHNVILNRVLCADGKYRALDGQDLLRQRFAASAVADRVLMERMARLGFEVRLNADGTARELVMVPVEVNKAMSQRRQQIDAAVQPHVDEFVAIKGRQPTASELANMRTAVQRSTRAAKSHRAEPVLEMIDRLNATTASETGYTLDGIAAVMRVHHGGGPVAAEEFSPSAVLAEAVAAAAAKSATWGRADLILEIERRLPVLGLDDDQVPVLLDALTDTALDSADVVQVTGHQAGDYAAPSATRYASAETLIAEKALRDLALQRSGHALDPVALKAWLDENAPTLGADQRAVIEGLATSDAALSVVVGPAGAGKSFTAGTFADAWHAQTDGTGRVIGLATSDVAAKVLVDDGITASQNIALWLVSQDALAEGSTSPTHAPWALGPKDVVMVDEASMVSTAHLDAIRRHVAAAGARIALTGDPRQLASPEAGGVMDLLDGHAETYTLTDIRRFHETWEREASLRVRAGDITGLDEYEKHGRLLGVDTLEEAIAVAARGAVADRMDDKTTVVVASTNDLAARVACQVRDQLVDLGLVQPGGVTLGRDGNTGGIGDVIMCRRIDRRIGVTNRAQYKVLHTREDGSLTVQELPRPGQRTPVSADPIEIPAAYVADDVQLGYAGTIHSTQGLTVQRDHSLTDGSEGPAALYVAMTRGQERNTVIVALNKPGYEDGETGPEAQTGRGGLVRVEADAARPTALSVLQASLTKDDDERLAATVAAERDQEQASSMTAIVGRLDAETRLACRNRLERHLDDLVVDGVLPEEIRGRLAADQGTEYLAKLLRAVEQTGKDPRQVLTDAITSGKTLDDAESAARVLSYRISRGQDPGHPIAGTEIPADITPDEHARLAELHERAGVRTAVLGARVAEQAPEWALQSLGPVPSAEDVEDRADWEHKAGQVAAHREAVGWDHPDQPLGRMPGTTTTERRTSYVAAWDALDRPEPALTEAGMSEGQLRVRKRAWDNAQAWAPANVDPALRDAELAAQQARQDAALARAENRLEDAERLAAEAEQTAWTVERLTKAADARAKWFKDTTMTHVAGDAAQAEADRRGIDLDHEPDRTTAEEWLTAEHQARAADDERVELAETELHDHEATTHAAWSIPDPRSPELAADPPRPNQVAEQEEPGQATLPGLQVEETRPKNDRENASRTVIEPSVTAAQAEALAATAALVTAITADHTSEEAAHLAGEQEHREIDSLEAGRRRRDAAELDNAITTGHDTTETGTEYIPEPTPEPAFDLGADQ